MAYDAWSHTTGVSFGSGDSDAFGFDAKTGRMTSYGFAINGQSDSGALTWNTDGSLAKLAITDPFSAGDTQTCSYSRDDMGRLSGVNCGSEWSQTFALDALGNAATSSGNNAFTASFSNNRFSLFNSWAPNYDADGNLLDNPLTQVRGAYGWDADGKAVDVDGASQTFDALGRVVYSSLNSTDFLYAPGGGKIALMGGQSLAFSMVPLPGGATAMYSSSGLWYYGHGDWEGSWRLASTPSRTVYGNLAYSPYGIAYAGSGPDAFTGQIVDTPDNLNDFPIRLLQATMARWLSPDPGGLAVVNPADPQSWNPYAYVENQPLSAVDPLGLDGDGPVISEGLYFFAGGTWQQWLLSSEFDMGEGWGAPVVPHSDAKGDHPDTSGIGPQETVFTTGGSTGQGADQGPPNELSWWQTLLSPVHNFNDPRPDCAVVSLEAIGNHLADEFGFGPPGADASAGLDVAAKMETAAAGSYALGRALTVPLRSSVYRSMMGIAEGLSDASVAFALIPIWRATVEGGWDAAQAARTGACQ